MSKIQVEVRSVYGRATIYPANEAARALCELIGAKTLQERHLRAAINLGHTVEEVAARRLVGVMA